MKIGIPKEIAEGESRVGLVPETVKALVGQENELVVEAGAGAAAGFDDAAYEEAGATIAPDAADVWSADLVVKVGPPQERADGKHEADLLREGAHLVCLLKPLDLPELAGRLAERKVSAFSLELMPRITRAQSMDVLSSQSTISGYQAVLLAAVDLPRVFPMLVTAAGTLQPARVLVIGAGVAGLQALGTAKRLGGVTYAYDTRPVVKEQVESLGARFVELDLEVEDAQDSGGYAKAQTEEFYVKQREELGKHVSNSDVVITTALVPGQPAPFLITEAAVQGMKAGSVIVDLAAEKGGNCELTEADRVVVKHGVTLVGHTNLPAQIPTHASQMFSKNVLTFLDHLMEEGALQIDLEDEITQGTLLTHDGQVLNEMVRGRLEGNG